MPKYYAPAPKIYELGTDFYDQVEPARFPNQIPRFLNQAEAARVGLQDLLKSEEDWIRHLCHYEPLPDNIKHPLALRYHGHQFQSYNHELGDGRGFLYGQIRGADNQELLDLGTKGSGQTPYSRFGDGRLTLKGAVRESLATERLESLGVRTSKTFSFFETGEELERNDEPSPTRSAVLTRLSHSHIRIGSFERLAFLQDTKNMKKLLNYCMAHLLASEVGEHQPKESMPLPFFAEVQKRSARLAAQWMLAGFVHGVLNTDNINITGESFDYGPFRFLPTYDPSFVAAYFDHSGLYAYGRQPSAVHWNLAQLAGCLSLLGQQEELKNELENYPALFSEAIHEQLLIRLGLKSKGVQSDDILLSRVFLFLKESQIPFEPFFFDLFARDKDDDEFLTGPRAGFYKASEFQALYDHWRTYEPLQDRNRTANSFKQEAPPDLRIDSIEAIWDHIAKEDHWQPYEQLIASIRDYGVAMGFRKPSTSTTIK